MAKRFKQYLDTLVSRQTSSLSDSVREYIYVMLPSGLCSVDHVAKRRERTGARCIAISRGKDRLFRPSSMPKGSRVLPLYCATTSARP